MIGELAILALFVVSTFSAHLGVVGFRYLYRLSLADAPICFTDLAEAFIYSFGSTAMCLPLLLVLYARFGHLW